jgi:hypothetical protein
MVSRVFNRMADCIPMHLNIGTTGSKNSKKSYFLGSIFTTGGFLGSSLIRIRARMVAVR